jgi:hypothetical protein
MNRRAAEWETAARNAIRLERALDDKDEPTSP